MVWKNVLQIWLPGGKSLKLSGLETVKWTDWVNEPKFNSVSLCYVAFQQWYLLLNFLSLWITGVEGDGKRYYLFLIIWHISKTLSQFNVITFS